MPEAKPVVLQEVLPKAGLVYSEKSTLSEILSKPKIMPIKSLTLEKLEEMEKEPPKMPGGAEGGGCLHRAAVSEAVDRYGEAWARQDEDAIASLFTEEGRYVERIGNDVGTFVGRDAIRKYWRKQIRGKQSDIQFRHVVEDMVLDSARSTATVKWVASFTNRHTVTRETATVEFTQIAILTFVYVPHREESAQGFLVSQLEEYWHSPNTDKRAKGAVYPKREKQRNRSRNLQANLARVRALGLRPPSLADYAMS